MTAGLGVLNSNDPPPCIGVIGWAPESAIPLGHMAGAEA